MNSILERLELRPGWFVRTIWLIGAAGFGLVGAIGWAAALSGGPDPAAGWILALGGTAIAAVLVALLLRYRLILSAEGFRVRPLWRGRLVPWKTVREFVATDDVGAPGVVMRGVRWQPVGQPYDSSSRLRRLQSRYRWYFGRDIPVFGRSREEMLATLETWRQRYG